MTPLAGLRTDVWFGIRMLFRQPWSTLSIAATLALGIGATTAIYAIADTGSQDVAVISERIWRAKFGGTPDALGRALTVNGHPFVVIGVASRFRGWDRSTRVGTTDVWLPIGSRRAVTGEHGTGLMGDLVGRARPGSSLAIIEQRLQTAYADAARALPPRYGAFMPFADPGLFPVYINNNVARRLYWLLMGSVTLLLLLACANAANLLLTTAARRERDTAVRLAIGAGQWRILRQFVVESFGVAVVAGVAGLTIAKLLTITFGGMRLLAYFPDLDGLEIDARVLSFCVLVTIATVLVFGLLPAVLASRTDIRGVLGRSARTVASPHRLRRSLVVAQTALSVTLVIGAGILNRSLQNLFAADLGMNLDHVIELALKPDDLGYDAARSARTIAATMDALRRSGFHEVAVSSVARSPMRNIASRMP